MNDGVDVDAVVEDIAGASEDVAAGEGVAAGVSEVVAAGEGVAAGVGAGLDVSSVEEAVAGVSEDIAAGERAATGVVEVVTAGEGVAAGVGMDEDAAEGEGVAAVMGAVENAAAGEDVAAREGVAAGFGMDAATGESGIDRAVWGDLNGQEIVDSVNSAYLEVVRWRRNIFQVPTGSAGEHFIAELTKLYCHFNDSTAFKSIALTLSAIIFPLLLQKPSPTSKTRDHVRYLQKRLLLWRAGKLEELLSEGRAIQKRFSKKKKPRHMKQQARFISLMEQGKISSALRCIGSQETSVLEVTSDVLKVLQEKHPKAEAASTECLYKGPLPRKLAEEVIFENIDSSAIHKAAKKVNGAAGPSGGDSNLWQRLLCSRQYKKKPAELCQALAVFARKLCTEKIHPEFLRGFVAGRLIPLDKQPGVRPIGIGEIPRRIVSSATVSLLNPELVAATAPLQTCAGLPGGMEASIHAMRRIFEDEETEGILLVDASNAFNAMNREAALHNAQYTCPELSTFVHNIYGCEAELFIPNTDEVILSEEGTTQGGPESMAFYATSMIPLSAKPKHVKGIFYADDGSGGGKLVNLKEWWSKLKVDGPPLGYFPYPAKTWCGILLSITLF